MAYSIFLEVQQIKFDWYAKCIQSSNLVSGVSEDVYLKLLLFVATNWGQMFRGSNMMNIPLFKYGSLSQCSVNDFTYGAKRLVLVDPNHPPGLTELVPTPHSRFHLWDGFSFQFQNKNSIL
ncbi:hypothetical protein CR513_03809, partial [Mucuna pruriens]